MEATHVGRCPDYLDVSNFDALAGAMGLELTDDGVSALGEITELLARQILDFTHQSTQAFRPPSWLDDGMGRLTADAERDGVR
jgi:hypothetical protein